MGAISPGLPEEIGSLLSSLSATENLIGWALHEPSEGARETPVMATIRAAGHTSRSVWQIQCQAHEKSRKNTNFDTQNPPLKSTCCARPGVRRRRRLSASKIHEFQRYFPDKTPTTSGPRQLRKQGEHRPHVQN